MPAETAITPSLEQLGLHNKTSYLVCFSSHSIHCRNEKLLYNLDLLEHM